MQSGWVFLLQQMLMVLKCWPGVLCWLFLLKLSDLWGICISFEKDRNDFPAGKCLVEGEATNHCPLT